MTPTQEQIEAAALAIEKLWRTPPNTPQELAVAALTAAAGVVTEQHIARAKTEANDDWIAKVGKTQGPDSFHPSIQAAAVVGDAGPASSGQCVASWVPCRIRDAATIERCAEVVDKLEKEWQWYGTNDWSDSAKAIAAAIRALKDKL